MQGGAVVKIISLPTQGTQVRYLGQEDPLEGNGVTKSWTQVSN